MLRISAHSEHGSLCYCLVMDSKKKRLLLWLLFYSVCSSLSYWIGGDIGKGLSVLGKVFILGFLVDVFEVKSLGRSFQGKSDRK